ncbi:hypothetical protein GCM10020360_17370 [Nonlabens tegetincola]
MAGLTHFFDNELADSMHGVGKGGLTDMGREAIVKMEQLGIVVDIAHASHQSVAEVLEMATKPVVASHGGIETAALGSDYDGSTEVAWDTSELAIITQELLNRGYDEDEIYAIMGGNTMRVLAETLPAT